jgi:hypothetical protein
VGRSDTPRGVRRPTPDVIEAHPDEWVSDRNDETKPSDAPADRNLLVDLAAERSLTEIFALTVLTPMALTGFWVLNAMKGRVRF